MKFKRVEVVGAVILSGKGDVLCALRSEQMSTPGVWEFPGGKMEHGEIAKDALLREIQEELGCVIQVGEWLARGWSRTEHLEVCLDTYLAWIVEGEPIAKEHELLCWKKLANLRELDWAEADLSTLKRLEAEPHLLTSSKE